MTKRQARCCGQGMDDCSNWATATYEVKLHYTLSIEPLCVDCVDALLKRGATIKLLSREVMDR